VAEPVARGVGDARRHAPNDRVALTARDAPTGCGIPPLETLNEGRNVMRIVLQIGIHGDHALPARRLEAGVGGGGLPGVGLQTHQSDTAVGLAQGTDDLRAVIATAVVDEDDLERHGHLLQDTAELGPELREIVFFVVDRDDDRQLNHACRATPARASGARSVDRECAPRCGRRSHRGPRGGCRTPASAA